MARHEARRPVETAKPATSTFDILDDLEIPIFDAVRHMSALTMLLEAQLVPIGQPGGDHYRMEAWQAEAILMIASRTQELIDGVEIKWKEAIDKARA